MNSTLFSRLLAAKGASFVRRCLVLLGGLTLSSVAFAQDYTFSNHNLVPFSLNPALAGNANAIRLGLNYRMQWPSLANNYNTVRVSYDQPFYKRMCSLGVAYAYDNHASGVYVVNEFSLVYAHTLELTENAFLRLGLQGTMYANSFGYDKLQYGDQYDAATNNAAGSSIEDFDNLNRQVFDFSFGAAFNIPNTFTIGGAIYHIAEPDNGFVEKSDNSLYRKYVVHANYMHNLRYSNGLWSRREPSDNYFYLKANYQQQDDYQMARFGFGLFLNPLIAGVSEGYDFDNEYTTSFMLGASYKDLQIFYTFDLFTNPDENGSWSHQFDVVYIIQKHEKFPCPMTFW